MSEEKKNEILDLIDSVDRDEFKVRKRDLFGGSNKFPFASFCVIFVLVELSLFFSAGDPLLKLAIALAFSSFMVAFFSFLGRFVKDHYVTVIYRRIEKSPVGKETLNDRLKPLLKALVKMKVENPEFSLKQVYSVNKSLFTEKKLLETLYRGHSEG